MSRFVKILAFNAGLSAALIVIFSPGLAGLRLGGEAFETALGVTVIFAAITLFGYVNYKLLTPKKFTAARPDKFQTLESCIIAINEYLREESKVFSIALNKMTDQLKRMKRKQESFKDILLRKFSASEMSYAKFHEAVSGAEKLMKSGVRAVLTRLYAFDEDEYKRAVSAPRADRVTEEKRSLFREYENFINNAIEGNEDVLLKLDRLTLELSKLGDASDIDEMNAIAEIDALIQNARWYR